MDELKCRTCGAEWLPGTSYCRQCGSAIADAAHPNSEQTTALLDPTNSVATQRLDPRPTSPDRARLPAPIQTDSTAVADGRGSKRRWLAIVVLAVLIVGTICAAAFVKIRNNRRTTSDVSLVYPGAQTVVDMTNEGGGRALQLQTSDSFNKVEEWYQNTLKPQKTMRLNATSVVLKNDKTTATIVVDGSNTVILLKIAP